MLRRRWSVYVHDGQMLHARTGVNSQKAHDICQHDKVSLAITPAYQDWQPIRGLSMAGAAALVDNADEAEQVADQTLFAFPSCAMSWGPARPRRGRASSSCASAQASFPC